MIKQRKLNQKEKGIVQHILQQKIVHSLLRGNNNSLKFNTTKTDCNRIAEEDIYENNDNKGESAIRYVYKVGSTCNKDPNNWEQVMGLRYP